MSELERVENDFWVVAYERKQILLNSRFQKIYADNAYAEDGFFVETQHSIVTVEYRFSQTITLSLLCVFNRKRLITRPSTYNIKHFIVKFGLL